MKGIHMDREQMKKHYETHKDIFNAIAKAHPAPAIFGIGYGPEDEKNKQSKIAVLVLVNENSTDDFSDIPSKIGALPVKILRLPPAAPL
jgi:hypothetical protein